LSAILRDELALRLPPHRSADLGALLEEGALSEETLGGLKKGFVEGRFAACEVDADAMKILPPVPAPSKIIAVGRNYPAHVRERGKPAPKEPILFAKLASALIGHGEAIRLPHWVHTRIDHEVELAVVIGRVAKDLRPEEALDAVFGYTVFNDVTARELQHSDKAEGDPWLKSKSFDTFAPMGPAVVPASDLPDPHSLRITLKVNDEIRQDAYTSEMSFDIPTLLATITGYFTLVPGDVVATGTPAGVGPLHPGDTVKASVESIGSLVNPVVRGSRHTPKPTLPETRLE
jgi:2-keto-4-pentenoate hydratase/2-oxohepta-3-ene-1,7-dioic acid hydratase in catechol pathway